MTDLHFDHLNTHVFTSNAHISSLTWHWSGIIILLSSELHHHEHSLWLPVPSEHNATPGKRLIKSSAVFHFLLPAQRAGCGVLKLLWLGLVYITYWLCYSSHLGSGCNGDSCFYSEHSGRESWSGAIYILESGRTIMNMN